MVAISGEISGKQQAREEISPLWLFLSSPTLLTRHISALSRVRSSALAACAPSSSFPILL